MRRSHYSYRKNQGNLEGFQRRVQLKVYDYEQKKGVIDRALTWIGLAIGRKGKEKGIADNKSC